MLWRLVDSDLSAPQRSAACDEAMLLARQHRLVPNTLHLYRRGRPTVSLGYFENVEECLDMDAVRRHGVELVRRASGGSAIYTDPGQIIYAVIVDSEMVPESPNETFALICGGIVKALDILGLKAEFKPVNDVLVNKRKISGSAQMRKGGVVLQHGTLMVDTNFEIMFDVLRMRKIGRSKDTVTSLAKELNQAPSMERVKQALIEGFSSTFDVIIDKGVLTRFEERKIEELVKAKYGLEAYTMKTRSSSRDGRS
ncbi:MAG: lipoate--protein ligase family protein [Methanomassiliicoccales archaeon]|nr:lipoate--protein ligase family protein [Methanomassiliicoccales archaeon]MDD1756612.1 lipoate--protein ligase family protein [Methanomassiliicoccales archaeon]